MVTSTLPKEGKTTLAYNNAKSWHEVGENVLLLDGDMRKSRIKEYLNMETNLGLTHVLQGKGRVTDAIMEDPATGLQILLAGEPTLESTALLEKGRFVALLEELKRSYDRIVVDTPTYGAIADATIIAGSCDGVVLVVEEDRTKIEDAAKVIDQLGEIRAELIGVVLTKATLPENLNMQASYYNL
ncbi:CpsD/CapB family tyrosine-protein kinase [Alkalibacter rhizosphaerae]|uniref:non-specific protein-tyrosine kinase n=1 Tax=Alkalibacter rhizosphaerae TaxID=2815577 RepID=A0A974XG83_9FIRM|nr:CpsD/CapB family tyrosine-protein kinase [Alkalibacter rhizosphaerae]QSX09287.1 CpsD/CapB family tyrosine-protein kinase [Alkalibacter rhizosphaerae]